MAQLLPTTSLYVGDLEGSVMDSQLYELFSQAGQVVSVRVCRDVNSQRSLGYTYVNFSNPMDAGRALEVLNFAPLNNKPIRIMYSNCDPNSRRSGSAFYEDEMGQSKGFGFVQYENEEAARSAIKKSKWDVYQR